MKDLSWTDTVRRTTLRTTLAAILLLLSGACDGTWMRPDPSPTNVPVVHASTTAKPDSAPVPAPLPRTVPAVNVAATFTAIQRDLRELVVAEEAYFAENGTYTADLGAVRFKPPAGAAVTMLWATREGWAARASHPAINGKDCVVYVGSSRPAPATRQLGRQAAEGVPVCDLSKSTRPAAVTKVAVAKRSAPPAAIPDTGSDTGSALDAASPIVQMKVDLRNLVRSQESWFGAQGAYARRIEPLAIQYLSRRGVRLRIVSAGRDFWSAKATHAALPGKSCVIAYGPVPHSPLTDGQRRQPSEAAVPVCDDAS